MAYISLITDYVVMAPNRLMITVGPTQADVAYNGQLLFSVKDAGLLAALRLPQRDRTSSFLSYSTDVTRVSVIWTLVDKLSAKLTESVTSSTVDELYRRNKNAEWQAVDAKAPSGRYIVMALYSYGRRGQSAEWQVYSYGPI